MSLNLRETIQSAEGFSKLANFDRAKTLAQLLKQTTPERANKALDAVFGPEKQMTTAVIVQEPETDSVAAPGLKDDAFGDYENYLTAIFRPGDTLCFVGIVHNKDKAQEQVVNDFVSYEKAISREYFEHLQEANSEASIYVATNTFPARLIGETAGRTQENVVDVRAVQADVDYNGDATMAAIKSSQSVPQPSIVVASSPGKFQGIWLVDGIAKPEAKPLMQAIAAEFKTDSAVAEVARVMRVPGFVNRKYEAAPVARTLVQTNARYHREDFKVHVAASTSQQHVAPEEYLNAPFIRKGGPYGGIYNHVLKIVGHYVDTIKDGDVMFDIVKGLQQRNGCFYSDGVTEYEWNEEQVRQQCVKLVNEWKDQPSGTWLKVSGQQAEIAQQPVDVSNWQSMFRSVGEMDDGPIDMIIEGVLQEGTCFFGANAGDGKTLVALAFAKAICTGTPLFGMPQYPVEKPRPVIYLIPETRDRAFRKRCEAFRIPDDKSKFMARTISAGVPLALDNPALLEAVRQTKAVVILDTAARFMKGGDENAAAQNRLLVNDVVTLLAAGAVCVILIHHATKSSKQNQEDMTLENMLRGTGDFGAMADQAYGLRKDMLLYAHGAGPMEIDFVNLKDREQIGGLTHLRLAASRKPPKHTVQDDGLANESSITLPKSYINETGNFHVVSDTESLRRETMTIENAVKGDPTLSAKSIADMLGITQHKVEKELKYLGYHRVKGGPGGASPWHKDEHGTCPFEVKPKKQTFDLGLAEAVKELGKLLEGTTLPDGHYVAEPDVLAWADKRGIPEAMLSKARRRLGVVLSKENGVRVWQLPEPNEEQPEANAAD